MIKCISCYARISASSSSFLLQQLGQRRLLLRLRLKLVQHRSGPLHRLLGLQLAQR